MSAMSKHDSRIGLLDAEPDIGRVLTPDEQLAASKLTVPVEVLPNGPIDLRAMFHDTHAFGAILLEGMLLAQARIGDQVALRLLGPGDVLSLPGSWRSSLLSETGFSAAAPTSLALLGNEVLLAARRWPRIVAALHVRLAEQSDRLATQLAICQLPRVDQRLLAIMWLLAESWGQVTSVGTRLPLNLTHDALGALVGARRPTVTLALGELTERGAIVRQKRGWLLLEHPIRPSEEEVTIEPSLLVEDLPSVWGGPSERPPIEREFEALRAEVERIRDEHIRSRDRVVSQLGHLAKLRERASDSRQRIAEEGLSRRSARS